ncbi:uncharacterized protein LOC107024428 [Solanum pennellii]|uniref:Uncharacterized protein LOC107024428 n=1 Tax=Solanum pennellii TaxID=28526 RepID=A0ABM1H665_SOLPN|nr:uncharacterized protein LOC107024428 [Solanum pennellii]
MAAEVSFVVRIMNGSSDSSSSPALITKDLLGGCRSLDSKELDLDLQVPSGWEKRLDLKSGKVYLQRSLQQKTIGKLQDLNFPPTSKLFDEPNLDLKLLPSSPSYPSVCTLEKVKSALEKETTRKRSISSSNSSSSGKEDTEEHTSNSFAAGCPSCLLYVLIAKNHPKCPRCHTIVPLPLPIKKPRIDLNL